jgi:hypothetical protein
LLLPLLLLLLLSLPLPLLLVLVLYGCCCEMNLLELLHKHLCSVP